MRVAFYHRKPVPGSSYSIEGYFAGVRAHLPKDISSTVVVSPLTSRGVARRLVNVFDAPLHQADVNHITGDIHYACYLTHKKKTVLTIHDCATLHRLKGLSRSMFKLGWYTLPLRRVSAVTVVSEATKRDLLEQVKCDPSLIRVIPVFVSDVFRFEANREEHLKPRILQIGTAENKNLLRVAEALRGVPCHLRIIGRLNVPQRTALERFGVEHSQCSALSPGEVFGEYARCDAVLFASTFEGFGMPIIEANVVGRPVICGNVTSMPEVARDAACLVDPTDVASIRAGVLRVLGQSSYREHLVERGLVNSRRFSATTIALQYASLYREIQERTTMPTTPERAAPRC